MAKNMPQQDPEDVRTDLMAAMAASRELGPEMDKAVVDSYMEKHHPVSAQQPAAQAVTQAEQRPQSADLIGFIGLGVGLVAYIAILIASHGWLWWLFWPIMGWAGWRWGGGWGCWGGSRSEYRQSRMEYRAQQREMRMQRRASRYGLPYRYRYSYEYGYDDEPPQAQQAQQPQQTAASPQYPSTPALTSAPAIPPAPAPVPQQPQMQPPASGATPQPPVNPAG